MRKGGEGGERERWVGCVRGRGRGRRERERRRGYVRRCVQVLCVGEGDGWVHEGRRGKQRGVSERGRGRGKEGKRLVGKMREGKKGGEGGIGKEEEDV